MRIFANKFSIVVWVAMLMCAGTTNAALLAVGPTNPVTTLPEWYQDSTGLALAPCIDQNNLCALPPQFDPQVTLPPDLLTVLAGAPPISDLNWPNVSFFFLADSSMDVGPTLSERADLRLAFEAGFLGAAPPIVAPGQGTTFLQINLQKMRNLTPNSTYTVTHPYGTFQFTTDDVGDTVDVQGGQAFRTEDPTDLISGIYFPPDLQNATTTHIGPFLIAAGGPVTDPGTGRKYVGDPNSRTAVTGSPTGNNVFRIDGPDIGGTGVNTIETPLFALAGKIVGLEVTQPAGGNDFGVWKLTATAPAKTYTVTNLTGAPAAIAPLSSSNPDFTFTPAADTCSNATLNALPPGNTCSFDLVFTPLAEGAANGTVTVGSTNGYSATVDVTGVGDSTPPTLAINPIVLYTTLSAQTITGTVTDTNTVASVQVSVNGVSQGTTTIIPGALSTWSKLVTLTNVNAANNISVTATDNALPAGNVSSPQIATITNDTINPVAGISSPAAGLTNNTTPSLTFTATDINGIATTTVILDNATLPSVPATLGPLAEGTHTVTVDVSDPAGNHNSPIASSTFTIDATPPAISITSPTAGTIATAAPTLAFSVTDVNPDPSKTVVMLDGNIIPNSSGSILGPFAPGVSHTLSVDATDLAGNISPTGSVTFIVNLGPAITVSPAPPSFANVAVNLPTAPAIFTISNNGNTGLPLEVTAITLIGTDPASFPLNNGSCGALPVTLPVGGSCSFSVRFAPLTLGAKSANVNVTSTGEATLSRSLTGNGVAAVSNTVRRTSLPAELYTTLTAAFAAATGNATLQAMNAILSAPGLTVNSTGAVSFSGGYDASFGTRTGMTAMQGVLTVQHGTLIADRIIIQ